MPGVKPGPDANEAVANRIASRGVAREPGRPKRSRPPRAFKAEQVYAAVKAAILSGSLEPGAAIDKLALGDSLGMSRFPITTAINRLAHERLVVIEPQHGSFVARIAAEDVRELMLIRRALEAEIAATAAADLAETQLERLRDNLRDQAAAAATADVATFYALDVEFHRLIVRGTGLRHAAEMLDGLRAQLERVRRLLLTPPGRLPGTLAQHQAIVDALRNRDAALAGAAMHAHLVQTSAFFETYAQERPALFSA